MAVRAWSPVLACALCLALPVRADPLLDPLVQGDPDAEALVMAVIAQYPAAVIEVVAKQKRPSPITGESYTLLKLTIDGEDRVTSIRDETAVVSLTEDLLPIEEAALVTGLDPVYAKMTRTLRAQIAAAQGGILGGAGAEMVPFDVVLVAASAAELAAISAALGATLHELFDASAALAANPPVFRPPLDGSPTPSVLPGDLESFTLTVRLELAELLQIGAAGEVVAIDADLEPLLSLGSSVPQIMADVLHGYLMPQGTFMVGTTSRIAILDTGIDDTHPDFNVGGSSVIAEASFLSPHAQPRCDNLSSAVCDCPGGNCGGGNVCVGGSRVGEPCILNCPGTGICEDLVGDVHSHGTHVAGTAANKGATVGVAPAAALIGARVLGPDATGGVWGAAAQFARGAGADVMNLSFESGSRCTAPMANSGNRCVVDTDCDSVAGGDGDCNEHESDGSYTTSLTFDHEVYQQNIHVAVAAGNSGSVGPVPTSPADAFNVITAGNATDTGAAAGGSTPGPTTDGRSKPDVMAPGTTIESMSHIWEGTNPDTVSKTGTSMAAPHVAGLLGVLVDWGALNGVLTDTLYLKAAIVNTCTQQSSWTRPSRSQPLDVKQGAGLVNALAAFDAYADDCRVWQQTVTGTEKPDSDWYYVDVDAATAGQPHTFTLVFERHSTQPDSAPPLNDLDLRVYSPSGAALESSISNVDSVEHIVITPGAAGRYCIEVDPFRLDTDDFELYALASSPLPLRFSGNRFPCLAEYGDAPDQSLSTPGYPTLAASNGAVHLDWTKEWLGGSLPGIDGEIEKGSLAVRDVVYPIPSATGENDADGTDDEDGVPNLDDMDDRDDGVLLPPVWTPGEDHVINVLVTSTINRTGFGDKGRYEAGDATKRIYLNAWADWNGDGTWDASEKIIGTNTPTGPAVFDPEDFGPNGEYTIGEPFSDINNSMKWEPGEAFTDTAGFPHAIESYTVSAPMPLASSFWLRFRLDYGEDIQTPDGPAAAGEVEDYHADNVAMVTGCIWEPGCGTQLWTDGTCWAPSGSCTPFPNGSGFTATVSSTPGATLDASASVEAFSVSNPSTSILVTSTGSLAVGGGSAASSNLGTVRVEGSCSFSGTALQNALGVSAGRFELGGSGTCTWNGSSLDGGEVEVESGATYDCIGCTLGPDLLDSFGTLDASGACRLGRPGASAYTFHPGSATTFENASQCTLADGFAAGLQDEWLVHSVGTFTDLNLEGLATLTGSGGEVRFDHFGRAGLKGAPNSVLVLDGATLAGRGRLGRDSVRFDLRTGQAVADDPLGVLEFDARDDAPSAFGLVMEATGGGHLSFFDSVFNGSGAGQVFARSASTVTLSSSSLLGGAWTVDPGGQLVLTDGELDPATFDSYGATSFGQGSSRLGSADATPIYTFHAGSSTTVDNGAQLALGDGAVIDTDGSWLVHSVGTFTDLDLEGLATFTGQGVLRFDHNDRVGIKGGPTSVFVLDGTTLAGRGNLGRDSVRFDLRTGQLVADDPVQPLDLDARDDGPSTYTIIIEATGGGHLRIVDTVLDGAGGGQVSARNSGRVTISSSTATDGSWTVEPGGELVLTNGELDPATFDSFGATSFTQGSSRLGSALGTPVYTFHTGSSTTLENGAQLSLGDGAVIDTDGSWLVHSVGTFTDLNLEGEATFTGGGPLRFDHNNRAGIQGGPTSVLVLDGATLSGRGGLGRDTVRFDLRTGQVLADDPLQSLDFDVRDDLPSLFQIQMEATGGGHLRFLDTVFDGAGGGQVFSRNGSTVTIDGSSLQNAALVGDPGSQVTLNNGAVDAASWDALGQTTFRNDSSLGGSALPGSYSFQPGSSTTVDNAAQLTLRDGLVLDLQADWLVHSVGSFTDLVLEGQATLNGSATVRFDHAARAGVKGSGSSTLVIDGPTLAGGGVIGQDDIELQLVSGAVRADQAGLILTLDSRNDVVSSYSGLLEAADQGLLRISGSNLAAGSGGEIRATGSNVEIVNSFVDFSAGAGMSATHDGTQAGRISFDNSFVTGGGNTISSDELSTIEVSGNGSFEDIVFDANVVQENGSTTEYFVDLRTGKFYYVNGLSSTTTFKIGSPSLHIGGGGTWEFSGSNTFVQESSPGNTLVVDDAVVRGEVTFNAPVEITPQARMRATGPTGIIMNRISINDGLVNVGSGSQLTINAGVSGSGSYRSELGAPISIGAVQAQTSGNFSVGDSLTVTGGVVRAQRLGLGPAAGLSLGSSLIVDQDFLHALTDESDWSIAASGIVQMNGGVGAAIGDWPQWGKLEVAGTDLGTDPVNHAGNPAGFSDNFELPELRIGPGARIFLRDLIGNGNRSGGPEALYVDSLVFEDGAGLLNTNGLHLYFNSLTGDPGQILDSSVPPPDPVQSELELVGTAQGGTISLRVNGVLIEIETSAGQSALEVLQALADAINGDGLLAASGVVAVVQNGHLVVNATISDVVIGDPGLQGSVAPIDLLPAPAVWLLVLLLMIVVSRSTGRARGRA